MGVDRAMTRSNYYINVYSFPNGKTWLGDSWFSRASSELAAKTAVKNGCKLLYRIHVRLK